MNSDTLDLREWQRLLSRTTRRGRPDFYAVDGESIEGKYVLLAASTDLVEPLVRPEGIRTPEALQWLLSLRRQIPKGGKLISYGFNFDVQNILRDLTPAQWTELTQEMHSETTFESWRLSWIPRKYFEVHHGHHAATIDDIAGFFGVSFVQALENLGIKVPKLIVEGKAGRGHFTTDDLPRVQQYNRMELAYMVRLADAVAALCEKLEFVPNRWYGPSVLAGMILEGTSLRHWRGRDEHEWPPELQDALRRAYYGGRIETLWLGQVQKPVYFYDIHSAYPAALQRIPALTGNYRQTKELSPGSMALYRLRFDFDRKLWVMPLPHRSADGRVSYPCRGTGWYWAPEIEAALHAADAGFGSAEILDGYVFETDGQTPMRRLLPALYEMRAQYKAEGDRREYVLKIAMNSLYGKLAQSKAGIRGARHRSLVWAGWLTSTVRRQLYAVAHQEPKAVLALATDALISEKPLELDLGPGLGQWEQRIYQPPNYLLGNGLYSLEAGKKKGHRGLPPNVDLADLFTRIKSSGDWTAPVQMKMLVSHRLANLHPLAYGDKAGQIIEIPKGFDPFRDRHRDWELPSRQWKRLAGGWPPLGDISLESAPSEQPEWVRLRNEELWCMVDALEDTPGGIKVDYRQLAVLE